MKPTAERTIRRADRSRKAESSKTLSLPAKVPPAAPAADEDEDGIRLSKTVAALANCSRSEAERYIEGGFVRVDGVVVTTPQFRVRKETVTLADNAALAELPSVTLIYHKPAGKAFGADNQGSLPNAVQREIGAANRSADDPSGIALLPRHLTRLTVPCPVEAALAGLVVLTQDGRIARKLIEDAKTLEQ